MSIVLKSTNLYVDVMERPTGMLAQPIHRGSRLHEMVNVKRLCSVVMLAKNTRSVRPSRMIVTTVLAEKMVRSFVPDVLVKRCVVVLVVSSVVKGSFVSSEHIVAKLMAQAYAKRSQHHAISTMLLCVDAMEKPMGMSVQHIRLVSLSARKASVRLKRDHVFITEKRTNMVIHLRRVMDATNVLVWMGG
tara:strand:- start:818 stop:1384 length:567 start_codon:yes stop_codon:yes gene_type:complete